MACRFANTPTPDSLWHTIMQGQSHFTPLAQDVPVGAGHGPFDRPLPGACARLDDLFACKPADQYFPRQINAGENQDLFFAVQLTIEALRDSGYIISSLPTDRVSLRLGYAPPFNSASVNWLQHTFFIDQTLDIVQKLMPGANQEQCAELRRQLIASLPPPNPYAFLSALGQMITSWISHLLGFAGPSFVIDAGTISGHQALQGAMDDLWHGRADIALAGAIQPPLSIPVLQGFSGTFAFSRKEKCHPFSRTSEGTLPGEGGAVFVLKRRRDALASGERIYASICSTGITAAALDQYQRVPTPARITRAMRRAMHIAAVEPHQIQLIEAHGSGVPHSDQTELAVLQEIFGEHRAGQALIALGSLKGNIGHTLWASGLAGVMKVALALHKRILPPHVEIEKPYKSLKSSKSALYLLTEPRPWIHGAANTPRRACVSSIDFTGTCATTILEEHREDR